MYLFYPLFLLCTMVSMAACSVSAAQVRINLLPAPVQVAVDRPIEVTFAHPGDGRIALTIVARAESARVEGYADALALNVNGKPVTGVRRLLNKPGTFQLKGQTEPTSWLVDGNWLVPIAPDFKAIDRDANYAVRGIEGSRLELDITDLVQPGDNLVQLSRTRRPWSDIPLQVGTLSVHADARAQSAMNREHGLDGATVQSRQALATDQRIEPETMLSVALPTEDDAAARHLLRITIRRQHESLGGYNFPAQFTLNGTPIDAARDRYALRLLNKDTMFTWPNGRKVEWNLGDGVWLAAFTPDFHTDFSTYAPGVDEPYTYLLDVTDLVATDRDNLLAIRNLYTVPPEQEALDFGLVASVEYLAVSADARAAEDHAVRPRIAIPLQLDVLPNGAIQLATDSDPLIVESTFSYPSAGRYNALTKDATRNAELSWKPVVTRHGDATWTIEARGAGYTLKREITRHDEYVTVNDTFHNPTNAMVGIILSNHLKLDAHDAINFCRMGGRQGQAINNIMSRENPTMYFPLRDSGFALVAEDDVYRNHAQLYFDAKAKQAGLRDRMLAIAPGDTFTLSWSIHATPSDDYFTLINRLRGQWDVNQTLDSPVYFASPKEILDASDESLRQWIDHLSVRYMVFWEVESPEPQAEWGGLKFYGFGTGVMHPAVAPEVEMVRQASAKLRRIEPRMKIALYSHSYFNSPEKPDDPKYKDSWVTDSAGNRQKSIYDYPGYVSLQPVFPTLENSYGQAYLRMIDFLLTDLELDWVYWDEINGPGVTVDAGDDLESYVTYNAWDRRSAIIDPATGKIVQTCGFLTLLSDDVVQKVINQAQAKGGFVLFNGGATTRSRIASRAFTETQDSLLRSYEMHLSSPLAYGLGKPSMAVLRHRLEFGLVYARTHIDYHSDVVARCYPLTVEEIGKGWVKGKERIITSGSGAFGWHDETFAGQLYLYGADGKLQSVNPVSDVHNGLVEIAVPEGGMAILERVLDAQGDRSAE